MQNQATHTPLTLEDFRRPGWAAETFSSYFNVHDGKRLSLDVLVHLDSIVSERSDETLRASGQKRSLHQLLVEGGESNNSLVTLTINNVVTQMVLECKNFSGVYTMAMNSLSEQQSGLLQSLSKTAVQRLAELDEVSGLGVNPSTEQMAGVASSSPRVEQLMHEFGGYLNQMLEVWRVVERFDPVGAEIMLRPIKRSMSHSPWYQFGMSLGASYQSVRSAQDVSRTVASVTDLGGGYHSVRVRRPPTDERDSGMSI